MKMKAIQHIFRLLSAMFVLLFMVRPLLANEERVLPASMHERH
jgi:hypothetical protein